MSLTSERAKEIRKKRVNYNRSKTEFCFSIRDVSNLTGLNERTLKSMISANSFNPVDLQSFIEFIYFHILKQKYKNALL